MVVMSCYGVAIVILGFIMSSGTLSETQNWTHLLFNLSDLMAVLYYVGCVEFNKIKILFSYLDVL